MVDFELTEAQKNIKEFLHWFAKEKMRSISLQADKEGNVPREFLMEVMELGISSGDVFFGEAEAGEALKDRQGRSQKTRISMIAAEELAWGDPAFIISFPGPGLGAPPIKMLGTPEQKKRFFGIFSDKSEPRWGAYALTEPGAGSDAAAISTTAIKDVDHYILNGRKCFITNGARASWVVVFATVDPKLGREGHRIFVVEKGTPGFYTGRIEEKMGLRASETAELIFEECRVPMENLLGGEEYYEGKVKEGFKTAMKTFDATRPIVGAMAVGIARAAFEIVKDWVKENNLLASSLPRFKGLRDNLNDMEREIDAARLLCWRAAWMIDEELPNSKEAAMAKAYSAQVVACVTSKAIEIMGVPGCLRENLLEKLYRDQKVFDIFEGTGQIQRIIISRRIYQSM
ncbi:MAG TPA: acyl-CoA dehydrogenase family protein [Thermodesulfobacteriota bacterium]|nr:acyl-CoA dehydrogenase family protein [Thermodesulfobacteriota bacterium]